MINSLKLRAGENKGCSSKDTIPESFKKHDSAFGIRPRVRTVDGGARRGQRRGEEEPEEFRSIY